MSLGSEKFQHSNCYLDNQWDPEQGKSGPSVGYGWEANGMLTKPEDQHLEWRGYGTKWKDTDIIEMIVDFKSCELSYKKNDIDYGKVFHIESTPYNAAVTLRWTDECASYKLLLLHIIKRAFVSAEHKLLLYQHIY